MRRLGYLLHKEFLQMFRNPAFIRMVLMMPLTTMLLMPWAATMDIRNLKVAVVDNDRSETSARLISKIAASQYFNLSAYCASYNDALHTVESGESDLIVDIPQHFAQDIVNNSSSEVLISSNAVNAMQGALGGQYMSATVQNFARELSAARAVQSVGSITVEPRYLFNPYLDSKTYMIPALMVMLVMMLCSFIPTLNIVGEKEAGTIEQINVSPVTKLEFLFAKTVPVWAVGFVAVTISLLISWLLYGLIPLGSILTIYLGTWIFTIGASGAGLLISARSSSIQQAMFVMFFFLIIFMLTSGLFTPIQSMPPFFQEFTVLNPFKYFIIVMRSVFMKGSTVMELLPEFGAMLLFAIGFNLWAVLVYRKKN